MSDPRFERVEVGSFADGGGHDNDIWTTNGREVFLAYVATHPDGQHRIHFRKSRDSGATWSNEVVIAVAPAGQFYQYVRVRIDCEKCYVIWNEGFSPRKLKFAKSVNGGTTWTVTTVDSNSGDANDILVMPSEILVSCARYATSKVLLFKSNDDGATWTEREVGSGSPANTTMIASEATVLVAYDDFAVDVKFAQSDDCGETWAVAGIGTGGDVIVAKMATIDLQTIYIFYQKYAVGPDPFKVAKSADGGMSWSHAVIKAAVGTDLVTCGVVMADNDNVLVTFSDSALSFFGERDLGLAQTTNGVTWILTILSDSPNNARRFGQYSSMHAFDSRTRVPNAEPSPAVNITDPEPAIYVANWEDGLSSSVADKLVVWRATADVIQVPFGYPNGYAGPLSVGVCVCDALTRDFFLQDWSAPPKLETAWLTDLTQSSGTLAEERRALADRPTRTLTVRWTGLTDAEVARLQIHLMRAASDRVRIPLYMDQSRTTGLATGTSIPCDTTHRRFHVGFQVLIHGYDSAGRITNPQVGTVAALAAGAITLVDPLGDITPVNPFPGPDDYVAGRAMVYPLAAWEIKLESLITNVTNKVGFVGVSFMEAPSCALPPSEGDFGSDQGGQGKFEVSDQESTANVGAGEAVILSTNSIARVQHNWSEEFQTTVVRAGDQRSQGRAERVRLRAERPQFQYELRFACYARADAYYLLRFFDSRCGRLVPFWFVPETILFEPVDLQFTHVDVAAINYSLDDVEDFIEYLAIVQKNGTITILKIASVTNVSGDWRLTFSGVSPINDLSLVARITQASFVRFVDDALEEEWITDKVCQMRFRVREVLNEATP